MNRTFVTSLLCGLITFMIVFSIVVGCSDDIVLEPLPSLLGEYEGEYWYIENYGTSPETKKYDIIFRFSDQNYWLFDNTDSVDAEGGKCICEPSGTYVLAAGVEIEQIVEGCAGCIFNSEQLPYGAFTLRQPTDPNTGLDSIVMTQIIGDVGKEIKLVPMGD